MTRDQLNTIPAHEWAEQQFHKLLAMGSHSPKKSRKAADPQGRHDAPPRSKRQKEFKPRGAYEVPEDGLVLTQPLVLPQGTFLVSPHDPTNRAIRDIIVSRDYPVGLDVPMISWEHSRSQGETGQGARGLWIDCDDWAVEYEDELMEGYLRTVVLEVLGDQGGKVTDNRIYGVPWGGVGFHLADCSHNFVLERNEVYGKRNRENCTGFEFGGPDRKPVAIAASNNFAHVLTTGIYAHHVLSADVHGFACEDVTHAAILAGDITRFHLRNLNLYQGCGDATGVNIIQEGRCNSFGVEGTIRQIKHYRTAKLRGANGTHVLTTSPGNNIGSVFSHVKREEGEES